MKPGAGGRNKVHISKLFTTCAGGGGGGTLFPFQKHPPQFLYFLFSSGFSLLGGGGGGGTLIPIHKSTTQFLYISFILARG